MAQLVRDHGGPGDGAVPDDREREVRVARILRVIEQETQAAARSVAAGQSEAHDVRARRIPRRVDVVQLPVGPLVERRQRRVLQAVRRRRLLVEGGLVHADEAHAGRDAARLEGRVDAADREVERALQGGSARGARQSGQDGRGVDHQHVDLGALGIFGGRGGPRARTRQGGGAAPLRSPLAATGRNEAGIDAIHLREGGGGRPEHEAAEHGVVDLGVEKPGVPREPRPPAHTAYEFPGPDPPVGAEQFRAGEHHLKFAARRQRKAQAAGPGRAPKRGLLAAQPGGVDARVTHGAGGRGQGSGERGGLGRLLEPEGRRHRRLRAPGSGGQRLRSRGRNRRRRD